MRQMHLVSHTHWDREWYLTFQQFRIKLVRLIDNLLDLLAADPDYRYFMLDGQTIVLEDYLAIRPEREAELRAHIQSGRILIGPWYILPDEFLVSPEATIRNLEEGELVARRFGPKMQVGYIPDPFGHIGQMPQILRGFGIEDASVMRGLSDQPCEFWWEAPDGSRVLMAYLRDGYGNAAGSVNSHPETFAAEARRLRDSLAPFTAASHLLLMHGTDHMEPNPVTSKAIAYAAGRLDGDTLIHSTLPAYIACIRESVDLERLPVVTGELRESKRTPLLPGVLSARMWIKQRNQACETLLEQWAEPFSAWAENLGGGSLIRSPQSVLRQAWRLLMQCHPHDSICGCSIDAVHEEMGPRFDQVEQIGEEITRQSLETIAARVDIRPGLKDGVTSAVIVFNPGNGSSTGPVTVLLDALPDSGVFDLVDENGSPLPYQTVGMGSSELFNTRMDRKTFRDSFGMVADGIVMGWKIRKLDVRCDGSTVYVDAIVSDGGKPDLAEWERGKAQLDAYMADPEMALYAVRAHTAAATEVLFAAPDVPARGYRTFWVQGKPAAAPVDLRLNLNPLARALMPAAAKLAATPAAQHLMKRMALNPANKPPYKIENEFLTVEAQPDGTLDVTDRRTGTLYRGLNRFVDGGDRGDTYNYSPPEKDRLKTARLKSVAVERGTVRQVIELGLDLIVPEGLDFERAGRAARLVTLPVRCRVALVRGVPRVEIHTEIDNRARDHRLRVHFPAPFAAEEAWNDGHFEVVRRPSHIPAFDDTWVEQPRPEAPQRAFTAVRSQNAGLLIANRGLPEVEVIRSTGAESAQAASENTEIALTLLRCVGWLSREDYPERKGHAGPFVATPGAQMQGRWAFDYAIVPFGADPLPAYDQARAFQTDMRAVSVARHAVHSPSAAGGLPSSAAFLSAEPRLFVVTAVRTCADGRGWLARGYNAGSAPVTARLKPLLPYASAEQVSLSGEPIQALTQGMDGTVQVEARGHQIITVRFNPAE